MTMSIRSSISALGSGLALALMLSAQAFADPPQFEQAGSPISIVEVSQQIQPKTPPKPQGQNTGPEFKPDVRIISQGQTQVGTMTKYRFRVENIGIGTASSITLANHVRQQHNTSAAIVVQDLPDQVIGSLATGQFANVSVNCTPLANHHCNGASINAVVAHDLNLSNNHADS
jgi:hypothetical protein